MFTCCAAIERILVPAALRIDSRVWNGEWNTRLWRQIHTASFGDEVKIAFLVIKVDAFLTAFHRLGFRSRCAVLPYAAGVRPLKYMVDSACG